MKYIRIKTIKYTLLLLSVLLLSSVAYGQQNYWSSDASVGRNVQGSLIQLNEDFYSVSQLNFNNFKQQVSRAPLNGASRTQSNTIINFPNEKGEFIEYRVYEAPVLSEELSERYPNIKTYQGFSTDNKGTRIRFSVTPLGLNAMISPLNEVSIFISPLQRNASGNYIIYKKDARIESSRTFECLTEATQIERRSSTTSRSANDQNLKTLRIAISTTGEYTQFWDDGDDSNGTAQDDALAQVVSTVNRMNEVYEADMAVTFSLVSGTEVIFDSPSDDPYTNDINSQVQATLTEIIGEENYDIGHLFDYNFGNGNAYCIGCVGVDNQKGSAFSSHPFVDNDGGPYMTDFFDIDYVCHEVGHQMGANHTFGFSNEGAGVNYEPGSGTTIMGYAGITGPDDVQDHTDPYFHYASIDQILDNLDSRPTVGTNTTITNNPPVANAGDDHIIPSETPFVLSGSATDTDTDDIHTYTWEQIDDGISHSDNFGPQKRAGAIFRSRPPSISTDRYLPVLSRVIEGNLTEDTPVETADNTSWETLTTVSREINFALTVRDRSEGNGPNNYGQTSFDTMKVTVVDANGPFTVTSQNTNETWYENSDQLITWNTANTELAPINATQVNILLSIDGGYTYPETLASNVANDGSHRIIVPENVVTNQARIMIKPVGNIFYAINSRDFSIETVPFVINTTEANIEACMPLDVVYSFSYETTIGFSENTVFSVSNAPTGATIEFEPASASADGTEVTMTVSNTANIGQGNYSFIVNGIAASYSFSREIEMTLFSNEINVATPITPLNNAEDISLEALLTWSVDTNIKDYFIEIATDQDFTTIIESASVQSSSYLAVQLESLTNYFWRVTGSNICATSAPSEVYNFITKNLIVTNFTSTDGPIVIIDLETVISEIYIPEIDDVIIKDVNVTINITHTFIGDLYVDLVSPNGTIIDLVPGRYDDGLGYIDTIFDDEATDIIEENGAAQSPYTGSFQPDGELSDLDEEHSTGTWTLRVWDFLQEDGGTIDNWSLEITGIAQDFDNDGVDNNFDICPEISNPDQADFDNDGIGDLCDDDIDNDGVLNVNDICNDTPLGEAVDVLGCSIFSLSPTNFRNEITSETCNSSNNGSIKITAEEQLNYTAHLIGNGLDSSHTFDDATIFDNLEAGEYSICISVENENDYEQCFNIVITEPEDLLVTSRVDTSSDIINLELSGGLNYNIELNGTIISTSENEISLVLAKGSNSLKVTTDKDCQGVYKEMINNSTDILVYPNPIINTNELHINTGNPSLEKIDIALYSVLGDLIFSKSVNLINGNARIDVSKIAAGMYLLNINSGLDQTNYKILKK